MQITDLQQEQRIAPLFRLGFRPFFLGGALFGVVAMILWLLQLQGAQNFAPLGGAYWWHIHEMVFGFACAIVAGFVLTAVQNWTGIRGVHGNQLTLLFALWLAARIMLLFPDFFGATLSTMIDLSFLPAVALLLAKPIIAIKQYRNLFFIPLLAMFTLANVQMHLAVYFPDVFNIRFSGYSAVLLIVVLMSIMAGRVTPMFTANGTGTPKAAPIKWLELVTNGSLVIAMLTVFLQPLTGFNATFFAMILLVAAAAQLVRWLRWRPWITLAIPLLWSLHFAILFMWFGLLVLGLAYLQAEIPVNHIWHLLTIGGIGGLILAMISRVSLGHTGRMLEPPKIMLLSFALIFIAALIRVFGPWLQPDNSLLFINLSGYCWLISYGIFVLKYAPMLLKARADDRPG